MSSDKSIFMNMRDIVKSPKRAKYCLIGLKISL